MSAAAAVATDVVETVADAAEETIEALDHLNNLNGTTRGQQVIVLVAVAVTGVVAGAVVSHYVTKHMLKTKFETMMEEELEKTREFYANRERITIDPSAPYVDPEEMLEKTWPGLVEVPETPPSASNEFLTATAPEPTTLKLGENEQIEVVRKNAFDARSAAAAEPDEEELKQWSVLNDNNMVRGLPYVLTKEEFFEAETEWPQLTYTFFEGDGVLADEREQPIEDVEKIVGTQNLARFGWLSEDKNTVYVRNQDQELEIEVVKSEGTYAAEVHGFQHSEEPFQRLRKGGSRVRYGEE